MSDGRQEVSDPGPDDSRLDPTRFATLYEASRRPLWCIAAAVLSDRSVVDDVLQESAMIALQKLEQFDPATSFVAWMGQIVRFTALNHARKRARIRGTETGGESLEPVPAPARRAPAAAPIGSRGGVQDTAWLDDHVLKALEALTEPARACLLLRTLLGMPYDEIARSLDMPEGTAMSHVHRARHVMRRELTRPARDADTREVTG